MQRQDCSACRLHPSFTMFEPTKMTPTGSVTFDGLNAVIPILKARNGVLFSQVAYTLAFAKAVRSKVHAHHKRTRDPLFWHARRAD